MPENNEVGSECGVAEPEEEGELIEMQDGDSNE